jgi:hypothetical protein
MINHEGKKIYEQVLEALKKETISGKTMHDWRQYFTITIPPDISPNIGARLSAKLANLFQDASFYKARADRLVHTLKLELKASLRDAVNTTALTYDQTNRKRPASAILLMEAENEVKELESACMLAEVELGFWKEVLSNLSAVRKNLENCTMNLGIERKMLAASYFDIGENNDG